MPVLGELNERAISVQQVPETLNKMKSGKAPGLDGFPVECLKKGETAVLECLVTLLNVSFDIGVAPTCIWTAAVLVNCPYKREGLQV